MIRIGPVACKMPAATAPHHTATAVVTDVRDTYARINNEMSMSAAGKRVLITGGSGFIGTNLVQRYLDSGAEVLNIDVRSPRNPQHSSCWKQHDILDGAGLLRCVEDFSPHWCFHLAARTDLNGALLEDYEANTAGVANVIQAVNRVGSIDRAIFASSMLVCGLGVQPGHDTDYSPPNAYGESKVLGEKMVRKDLRDGVSWTIVRPTSLWGPWFDIPYKKFFTAIQKGVYVHPKGCQVRRSYGFALNAIHELACIAEADRDKVCSRTLYLADYEPVDLHDWAEMIRDEMRAGRIREVPVGILKAVAKLGDVLMAMGVPDPPLSTRRINNMVTSAVLDMSVTEAICGTLPYTLQQGVEMTVKWMHEPASASR